MRNIAVPEPGYYKRRLVKGGPWVTVRFFRTDTGALAVEVDGQTHDPSGAPYEPGWEWPVCWPSDEAEYRHMERLRTWALDHAPHHPAARPRERIDLGTMPPRVRR
jgi:hypothetical protein